MMRRAPERLDSLTNGLIEERCAGGDQTPQANGCGGGGGGGVASAAGRRPAAEPATIALPAADAESAARLLEDFRPGSGADRAARGGKR